MKYPINMRQMTALLFIFLPSRQVYAQQNETFDLATYQVPSEWKKETNTNFAAYNHIASDKKSWCQLSVYKNLESKGSIAGDFNSEWAAIVKPQSPDALPQTGPVQKRDNWEYQVGKSTSTFNGMPMYIRLITFTDKKRCFSILARTNSEELLKTVDAVVTSLHIKSVSENTASTIQSSAQPSGFAYSVSNFDDGWVSTVMKDYVLVQKSETRVYLNYTIPYNASDFSGTGVAARDYYWENEVKKWFDVKSKQYNDGSNLVMKPPYVEGLATDRQTGKSCFIGMYLLISTNAVSVVVATAPSEVTFRVQFPNANDAFNSDVAGMTRYNKFAVGPADILGKWQNGNTETAQWYYESPSGNVSYAGMTLAATSATFIFNTGNNYSSIHNGATGSVGNMKTFQQEYKGTYSVSNWSVTATNRYNGKTDVFNAHFVAVRGGRILKFDNGAGQEYSLVKVKPDK